MVTESNSSLFPQIINWGRCHSKNSIEEYINLKLAKRSLSLSLFNQSEAFHYLEEVRLQTFHIRTTSQLWNKWQNPFKNFSPMNWFTRRPHCCALQQYLWWDHPVCSKNNHKRPQTFRKLGPFWQECVQHCASTLGHFLWDENIFWGGKLLIKSNWNMCWREGDGHSWNIKYRTEDAVRNAWASRHPWTVLNTFTT